jgi:hypothetical protein
MLRASRSSPRAANTTHDVRQAQMEAEQSTSWGWRQISSAHNKEESMAIQSVASAAATNATIAQAAYRAYVTKDRAALEALLDDDFHFTTPLDNRLDRERYFRRCWPNSEVIERFDFAHLVTDADRVFVTYEGRNTNGHRFRNT